jgi:SAM-dependent methyltransferase
MKTNRKFRRHVAKQQYRDYVGKSGIYDLKGAWQFMLLCLLGLRDNHHLLEIGCGSLRAARLFIPYLKPKRYFGLEAEQTMVKTGLENELGRDILAVKQPTFVYNTDFDMSAFGSGYFDFILSHSVIMHVSSNEVAKMIKESARVLAPRGIFVGSFAKGTVRKREKLVYPATAWYHVDVIKQAIKAAGLAYAPLHFKERHPAVRWFMAVHPKYKPTVLGDSIAGMINRYWYWESHGK